MSEGERQAYPAGPRRGNGADHWPITRIPGDTERVEDVGPDSGRIDAGVQATAPVPTDRHVATGLELLAGTNAQTRPQLSGTTLAISEARACRALRPQAICSMLHRINTEDLALHMLTEGADFRTRTPVGCPSDAMQ